MTFHVSDEHLGVKLRLVVQDQKFEAIFFAPLNDLFVRICRDIPRCTGRLGAEGKNRNKRRTMVMWKNALDNKWETRPIEATRKIIDRQPKTMRAIIEADGGRTPY